MTAYEYWVDNVNGSNSNNGSEGAPWLTLRHATTTGLPNGLTSADSVIINLVPNAVFDNADDYVRPESTECQGVSMTVRSAIPGTPAIINGPAQLIIMIGTADLDLRFEDIDLTAPQIMWWAGLTTASATGLRLTLAGSCKLTHSRTDAETALGYDSDADASSLTIEPGCEINGWSAIASGLGLVKVDIDGLKHDAGLCLAGTTLLTSADINIRNSTLVWPNSVNNVFQLRCDSGDIELDSNTFNMETTNTAAAIQVFAPLSGSAGDVDLVMRNNTVTGDTPDGTPLLLIGNTINESLSRAANDATVVQFQSGLLDQNIIYNRAEDGGLVRCLVGSDRVKLTGNYARAGSLGHASANVHQIYLWGADIRMEGNWCQASVLAFGLGQIIRDNIIVAKRCILLGGTQGGGTTSGGGNDYVITNNVLVSFANDCISDYAFNGAYGGSGHLGELRAVVDNNTYVVLSGSTGIANLTDANGSTGLVATTMEELRNLWQYTSLTQGTLNTWGEATNKSNDGKSVLVDRAAYEDIAQAGAKIDKPVLEALRSEGTFQRVNSSAPSSARSAQVSIQAVDELGRRAVQA